MTERCIVKENQSRQRIKKKNLIKIKAKEPFETMFKISLTIDKIETTM